MKRALLALAVITSCVSPSVMVGGHTADKTQATVQTIQVTTTTSTSTTIEVKPKRKPCMMFVHGGGFFIGEPSSMQPYIDKLPKGIEHRNVEYPLSVPGENDKWYPQTSIYEEDKVSKHQAYNIALAEALEEVDSFSPECDVMVLGISAGGAIAIGVSLFRNVQVVSVSGSGIYTKDATNPNSSYTIYAGYGDEVITWPAFVETCEWLPNCNLVGSEGGHGELRMFYSAEVKMIEWINSYE